MLRLYDFIVSGEDCSRWDVSRIAIVGEKGCNEVRASLLRPYTGVPKADFQRNRRRGSNSTMKVGR